MLKFFFASRPLTHSPLNVVTPPPPASFEQGLCLGSASFLVLVGGRRHLSEIRVARTGCMVFGPTLTKELVALAVAIVVAAAATIPLTLLEKSVCVSILIIFIPLWMFGCVYIFIHFAHLGYSFF